MLFGHNLRIADLMGRWNWIYGPPPFGLHYARHLFRDGFERGVERLRLMQPEAAGAVWDRTQTWRNALPEEDHPTTWTADRACEWLRNVEGPFFAWVSFTDPHHPMDPPAPWCDRYTATDALEILPEVHDDEFDGKPDLHRVLSRGIRNGALEWANPGGANYSREELATMTAGYYGMVAQLDHAIGRVLDVLDERGLTDDTLVIVTSDHGEFLGEHQLIFKGPFGYDSLLNVPLVMRGPGVPVGAVRTDPVGTIDLAPTMLAAAGQEPPKWMEGRVLDELPREHVLTENDFNIMMSIPMRTITTERYKLHRYLEAPMGELYDLHDDPGEIVNRYDDPAYAAVRAELLALLHDVMNHDVRREPVVGLVA
jgi:arylsulfatase A-like enzyme